MAINKIIYQDSNDALLERMARNGESLVTLLNTEHGVKSAASNLASKELLEKYRPTDDRTACIHLIAMGNSDQYGFNRNGDYFSGDALEKNAHTFVTNGHVFREHRNTDPAKAIGQVKWAGYDPKGMQRVELIVHLDKDKAEEEYEMAKKGSALNFSMSCRVPNDRCSCCGNEAKQLSSYCTHLRNSMGKWLPGINKYAFAYNDKPTFFDISRVKVPADRIARHLEYMFKDDSDGLNKAASYANDGGLVPSAIAAMAEGINIPETLGISEQLVLTKLAAAEDYVANVDGVSDYRAYAVKYAYPMALKESLTQKEIDVLRAARPETVWKEFAKKACVMSFPAFCQYITGDAGITNAPMFMEASSLLPSVFSDISSKLMSSTPCCTDLFDMGSLSCEHDSGKEEVQNIMDEMERKFSVNDDAVHDRVISITISISGSSPSVSIGNDSGGMKKKASAASIELARTYGQYQLKALSNAREMLGDRLSGNAYDIIAGANTILTFDK